jgi:hypothetical protein
MNLAARGPSVILLRHDLARKSSNAWSKHEDRLWQVCWAWGVSWTERLRSSQLDKTCRTTF